MGMEDLREQSEVTPGALGLGKKSTCHFAGGIVDTSDQTQAWPPTLEPVVR
jgi:hypothetical protein